VLNHSGELTLKKLSTGNAGQQCQETDRFLSSLRAGRNGGDKNDTSIY
jgi:hypothetical protein